MGKANPVVSVPGAPADTTAAADTAAGDALQAAGQPQGADSGPDPRDAEIERLRAQLAAAQAPSQTTVMEGDGPNTRRYKAESKHLHMTSAELTEKHAASWKGGKGIDILGGEHHVLCKDGWFVNPATNAMHNG